MEGIKEAKGSLDRGEGLDHEDVMAEMDALLAGQGMAYSPVGAALVATRPRPLARSRRG